MRTARDRKLLTCTTLSLIFVLMLGSKTFANTEFKLLASDGAAGDMFDVSVSIGVDLALVGAAEDEKIVPGSGKAYVYALEVKPGQATLISPSGTITDNTPTYSWNAVENSTWYYFWVNDSTGDNKIKKWYTADDANCSSGTGECSVTNTTVLADGSLKWWIQTWNEFGTGPWSAAMSLTVDTGVNVPPGKATLISPSGTITDNTPTYSWNAVENSTWYYFWVNDSTGDNKIKKWYTADDANCSSGTGECSVTNTTVLADGSCKWWIQTWNDDGYGPWSAAMSFTVNTEQGLVFNLDFGQDGTYDDYWLLEPGETVFTDVYVSNVPDPGLRSIGIKIVYDPSWLEVGTGTEVYAVNWPINNTFQDVLGEIRMVGGVFSNIGLSGNNIKLGTIEFNSVSMGTTSLWLYDSEGGSFDDFVLVDGTVLDYQIEAGIPVATIETTGGSSSAAAKSDPSAQSVISSDIDGTDNFMGPQCKGDFDNDGDVDGSDLSVFVKDFGGKNCGSDYLCMGDLDNDNDVDGSDLATFAVDFGRTDCP